MSHASGIGGYPGFQDSLHAFNAEADANIQGTQDRAEEVFRQERARLAQDAARYEEEQRRERAAFQRQQASQDASMRANAQAFDTKVDAYHAELARLEERRAKESAERRAKFQAEMQERERALDARIQAHMAARAAQASQPLESASVAAIPYAAPAVSPSPQGSLSWDNGGLAPLPGLSGGGFQQPPAAAQPAPQAGQGGLAPLPALAPLPPLGGDPSPPADQGGNEEQCIIM